MKLTKEEDVLIDLFNQHQEFAQEKFPDSTWESSLRGLEREIKEVEEAKSDYTVFDGARNKKLLGLEYIDCFMYLLDSMKRAGFDASDITDLFKEKLEINKMRSWNKNSDNTYSHT